MSTRLVYVVTVPVSADVLLRGQLRFMRDAGYDVTVITSPGPELNRVREREGVRCIPLPIARPINLRDDVASLARLVATLRELRPDIVNASTPKAGLLGSIAARAVRVPVRIYTLRGLRLETAGPRLKRVLGATERAAAACATDVVCVSRSLERAAVGGGYVPVRKARVLGDGSSNGVDVERFRRTDARANAGRDLLARHGVTDDDEIVGFVGRLDPDKGIGDLIEACGIVRARRPRLKLVMIGGGLGGDYDPALDRLLRTTPWAITYGKTSDLAPLYARMSVLAFPSYREGFPNVPLEAAAAGVPTVGYAATGTVDAVVNGVTGTLVAPRDVRGLAAALERYLADPSLREKNGAAAALRASRDFANEVVWRRWADLYAERLSMSRR